ncbi:MAG: hypothetical protein J5802_00680 [Butyrivibrio sp.]|nr:hypothetical protein [Butyrivibrio sp.]
MEGMSTKDILNGQDLSTVFVDDLLANNKSEGGTGRTPDAGSGTAVAEDIPDLEDILKEEKAKAERVRGDRPRTERSRIDRSKGDRPKVERLKFERPRDDRAVEERPRVERLREDRPRVERLREDRPERPERPERPDRFERSDRPERPDRFERSDRPERAERPERPERPDRPRVERLKEGRPRFDASEEEKKPTPEGETNTVASVASTNDVDAMMDAIRAKKDALGVRYPKIFSGAVPEVPAEETQNAEAPANEVQEEKESIPVINTSFGKMSEALRGVSAEEPAPANDTSSEKASAPSARPSFGDDMFANVPTEVVDILSDDSDDEQEIADEDVVMTSMAAAKATAKEIPVRRPVGRPMDSLDNMPEQVANILSQKQVNVDSMVAAAEAQAEAATVEDEFKDSVEDVKTSASFKEPEKKASGSKDVDAINAARAAAARARIASFKTAAVRTEVPVTAKTPTEIPVVSKVDIEEMNATREAAEGPIPGDADIDAMIAAMAEEDAIINEERAEAPEKDKADMMAGMDDEDISAEDMMESEDDFEESVDVNDIPVKIYDAGKSDMDDMIAAMEAEEASADDEDDFAMDEEPISEDFSDSFAEDDMNPMMATMTTTTGAKVAIDPMDLPLTGELEELMVPEDEALEETGLTVVDTPEPDPSGAGVADAIAGGIDDIKKFLEAENYEFTVVSAGANDMILLKVEDGSAMIITYENGELDSLEDGFTLKGMTSYNDIANSYLKEAIVSKGRKVMKRHKGTKVVAR